MTIGEFLMARLVEDEAHARQATEFSTGRWHVPSTGVVDLGLVDPDAGIGGLQTFEDGRVAEHVARHDPARVLAEVAAKRRILAAIEAGDAEWAQAKERAGKAPVSFDLARARSLQRELADVVLRNLAALYADHPDYDPAWRVQ